MISSRGLCATLFAAALLAFLLPFGTVSAGTPVTFTGVELATATVQGDEEDTVAEINMGSGASLAIVAGVSALVGVALALAGLRGQGWVALLGLVSLGLLPWVVVSVGPLPWDAASTLFDFVYVRTGFVLASSALAAVVWIRAWALLRRRRKNGQRIWPAVTGLCLLVLFLGFTAWLLLPDRQVYYGA